MLTRLRRFFRKPEPRPTAYRSLCRSVHIAGDWYARVGDDLTVMRWGSKDLEVCGPDHVAHNGVPVKQIAYAIALIEGSIAVCGDTIPFLEPN